MMNFQDLIKLEPRLQELADRIKKETADAGEGFCANVVWIDEYKPILIGLVGWLAENPALQTDAAYDMAYDHLAALLPECNHEPNLLCL